MKGYYSTRAITTVYDHCGIPYALTGETIIEQDKGPVQTGLLDLAGKPIWRWPDVNLIGFDLNSKRGSDDRTK